MELHHVLILFCFANTFLLIEDFNPSTFKALLMSNNFLPFCYLFSVCLKSFLFFVSPHFWVKIFLFYFASFFIFFLYTFQILLFKMKIIINNINLFVV